MSVNYHPGTFLTGVLIRLLILIFWLLGMLPAGAQTLHRGLGPEPDALDPHLAQGLSALNVLRDLGEGLLRPGPDGRPEPGLAVRWRDSEDGRCRDFELREQLRWSDGSALQASDFERAWRRALDPQTASPVAAWLDPVQGARAAREGRLPVESIGIRALGPDRLRVCLEAPVPWFEELLTQPVAFPMHPAGFAHSSGSFKLAERVPGAQIRLIANPHYHQADQLRLAQVVWHVTEDPATELNRFRAGELHITETIPPGRLDWLRDRYGERLRISPYAGSFFLAYNLSRPPFGGSVDAAGALALREALSLAIDRELITERVLGAGEQPAWRLVPPGLSDWPDRDGPGQALSRQQRVERARRLYQRAGYGPARPLTVALRFNSSLTHRRTAAAVAAMWKQHLGVQTRLVNEEWKVFVTNRRQGRITEVVRGGWIADWSDPANFLQLFESGNPLNYTFFSDQTFDDLLAQARGLQGVERLQVLRLAEDRLLQGHAIIPLYYYVSRHLVAEGVGGFIDNWMDIHLSRWLYLDD